MATRLWAVGPNQRVEDIVTGVGTANSSAIINVQVDLAASVTDNGVSRTVKREEVLQAMEEIRQFIVKGQWPPA